MAKINPADRLTRAVARFLGPELANRASGYTLGGKVGYPSELTVHFMLDTDELLAESAGNFGPGQPGSRCTAQHGGRGDGGRVVGCDLLAGHSEPHYEDATDTHWRG